MPSETAAPMHTTSRSTAVYSGIRDAILRHALAPGMKLSEDELGGIYGVSRTIVRSALQNLASDRLVVLEPNRGAFVAKPTTREAREVFEARALLEPKVAAMAAEAAKPKDAQRLRTHIEREHAATRAGKDGEALVLSAKFHIGIAEIAGHSIYTEFVRDLCSRSSLIIALYWKRRDTTCESHAHTALVEAIADHRPKDAAELMTSHLVDLLSGLDLSQKLQGQVSLAEALRSQ
ncbi:GntR family transcriptional regulator [Pelagibacterium halotolerans]|uniref:GntR family transcriptional regulator n=1 Tax=Pelagibacterium halotolerans TaxID=531813 RepID=UPI0038515646